MNLRQSVMIPIFLITMMIGVLAVQAEDTKPHFVEDGTPLPESLSSNVEPNTTSALGYQITTSKDDPSCDTGFGGYFDLKKETGIVVTARVPGGDGFLTGPFFTKYGPIEFYGQQYQGLYIADDGFITFDPASYRLRPWVPQIIPDSNGPNALAAMMWQDMKVVYNKSANKGVSVASNGSTIVVEYDNIQLASDPRSSFDMEIVMRRQPSSVPGEYEIVFAYDNLSGPLDGPLTIGIENGAGSSGVALVNKGSAKEVISNGFMVCFNAVNGSPPSATPSSIHASDGTFGDKIQVTWDDVSKAISYDVYRGDANGNSEIKLGTTGHERFDDWSAAAGITYAYRVKACNEYGCSSPSDHDSGWRTGDDSRKLNPAVYLPFAGAAK